MGYRDKEITPRIIRGEVEVPMDNVNILGNGTRIGHSERQATVKHILDVKDRGYITDQESEARINAALAAEKYSEINTLTSDLPAPFVGRSFHYDWDKTSCWLPTLMSGLGLSAVTAVLPTAILAQDHLFPHNAGALALGVITMVLGIVTFFSCIVGIIYKAD